MSELYKMHKELQKIWNRICKKSMSVLLAWVFFVIITVIGSVKGDPLNHKEEKSQWQRKEILLLVSLADLPL